VTDIAWTTGTESESGWYGEVSEKKGQPTFITLRKRFVDDKTNLYGDMMIVVATAGYVMKGYKAKYENADTTKHINVRMSMNGPCAMDFDTLAEINEVVEDAKKRLKFHDR
jgi:hypothetical protein